MKTILILVHRYEPHNVSISYKGLSAWDSNRVLQLAPPESTKRNQNSTLFCPLSVSFIIILHPSPPVLPQPISNFIGLRWAEGTAILVMLRKSRNLRSHPRFKKPTAAA